MAPKRKNETSSSAKPCKRALFCTKKAVEVQTSDTDYSEANEVISKLLSYRSTSKTRSSGIEKRYSQRANLLQERLRACLHEYTEYAKSESRAQAVELAKLLREKAEIEKQMAMSVKKLYRNYDEMSKQLEVVIVSRANELATRVA